MTAFPPASETWMVSLESLGDLAGPRFLAGRLSDGTVHLAEHEDPSPADTKWAVTRLADNVVKFRCMDHGQGARFLDGRPGTGTVGLRPMLAAPPSGEWWAFAEESDGVVTLECLSKVQNPAARFLNGRTLEGAVGLAPHTSAPFSGTHWRVRFYGRIVALECQGRMDGPVPIAGRFLDGHTPASTIAFASAPLSRFTGARWLMRNQDGDVTLEALGELEGDNRFLNGRADRVVDLAPSDGPDFPGTHWEMTEIPDPNADVELGFLAIFRCRSTVGTGFSFLDGILQENKPFLAPHTEPPFTGTLWRVLPGGIYFEPCPRFAEQPNPDATVAVVRTAWAGQITGKNPIDARPLINGDTSVFGVPGVDLGANTEDGSGRLFIFFGDVVRDQRTDGPVTDADLVAFTVDAFVEELEAEGGGGILLHPVLGSGRYFDEFRVAGPSGIGVTPTFEVASGAFQHGGKVFVFFHIWDSVQRPTRPLQGCYLASKEDPTRPGPFNEVTLFSPNQGQGADSFGGVAPVKVNNADHPWLPANAAELAEEGLVMFGIGLNPRLQYSGVHLAWMPLTADGPDLGEIRYFTDDPSQPWNPVPDQVIALFGKEPNLSSVSATFLRGPDKWIVTHMTADNSKRITGPVIARIGTPPFDWSEEFRLFDPCRERAYARYMHWPDLDAIHEADPRRDKDAPPPDPAVPGWAYGAFLMDRFTRWDPDSRQLELYYLLSTGSPYQVQVMHTTLRMAGH